MLNLQKDNFCPIPLIPKLQKGKGQSTDASDSNGSNRSLLKARKLLVRTHQLPGAFMYFAIWMVVSKCIEDSECGVLCRVLQESRTLLYNNQSIYHVILIADTG